MNAPKAIMLFAAGFGTRMGELTRSRPKPLIPVAGQPLIGHALELAEAFAPLRKVANVHYMADMMRAWLSPRGVLVSDEQPDILDTGGGLKAALPLLDSDPVFTMNSDAIWSGPNPLDCLAQAWDDTKMDALLICVPRQKAVGRKGAGDFSLDSAGRLSRGGGYVYGGVQILKTADVAAFPDRVFSLNRIWDLIAGRQRLYGAIYPGRWCDVGHPEGLKLAESLLSEPHV